MSLGEKIKIYRIENHLTQKELGEMVGLSRSGIAEIEGGRVKGTVDFIAKLAQVTNTSISYWAKGENSENIKCYNHESLDVLIDSMIDTGIIKGDGKLNEMAQKLILKVLEKEIIQRIEKNKRAKK